jgi:hypothetical protein
MNEHTPGPWAVGIETTEETGQVIAADGSHIAYVECDPVPENTRLIAAAPELLEALKDMMIFAPHEQYNEPDEPETLAIQRAQSAIALALDTR